ncbi:protein Star-like [Palaemon carinicauda]|uniref:protein Star-like n=1 Tax=Palaemon carinicauda TaxID=392227 RepID=UPI0035B5EF1D
MVALRIKYLLALSIAIYWFHDVLLTFLTLGRHTESVDRRDSASLSDQLSQETERNQSPDIHEYNYKGASMDDPKLVDYIRRELLHPPSQLPYNLKDPQKNHFSQFGQSMYADKKFLHGMKGGFFIEAGALDGEFLSNTLYFERALGWTGLLIEPNPETYQELRQKNRKAYTINAALSTTPEASDLTLELKGSHSELGNKTGKAVHVTGIPLYTILLAMNIQVVDFLSLDIEAFEVKILKTIPWDKVKFRLMCIEINHIPEGIDFLVKYLTDKGYKNFGIKGIDAWFGWPALLNETMHS